MTAFHEQFARQSRLPFHAKRRESRAKDSRVIFIRQLCWHREKNDIDDLSRILDVFIKRAEITQSLRKTSLGFSALISARRWRLSPVWGRFYSCAWNWLQFRKINSAAKTQDIFYVYRCTLANARAREPRTHASPPVREGDKGSSPWGFPCSIQRRTFNGDHEFCIEVDASTVRDYAAAYHLHLNRANLAHLRIAFATEILVVFRPRWRSVIRVVIIDASKQTARRLTLARDHRRASSSWSAIMKDSLSSIRSSGSRVKRT